MKNLINQKLIYLDQRLFGLNLKEKLSILKKTAGLLSGKKNLLTEYKRNKNSW